MLWVYCVRGASGNSFIRQLFIEFLQNGQHCARAENEATTNIKSLLRVSVLMKGWLWASHRSKVLQMQERGGSSGMSPVTVGYPLKKPGLTACPRPHSVSILRSACEPGWAGFYLRGVHHSPPVACVQCWDPAALVPPAARAAPWVACLFLLLRGLVGSSFPDQEANPRPWHCQAGPSHWTAREVSRLAPEAVPLTSAVCASSCGLCVYWFDAEVDGK